MALVVEIVDVPGGEAPEWVREAWVGLRVPCVKDRLVEMPAVGAVSGPRSRLGQLLSVLRGQAERRRGYVVKAREVVGLLSLDRADAARWWIDNVPQVLDERQLFMFEQSCCRTVERKV